MTARHIALALQGGGAHGAYTWGVLDTLLDDGRYYPVALSGASAGALNAALLADGWTHNGADGARDSLRRFWLSLAASWQANTSSTTMLEGLMQLSHFWTPAQLNPLGYDPLRQLLQECIDFPRLQRSPMQLFIAATHVESGRLKLFQTRELTVEHLLASACLPQLHRTVSIDGQDYWDGGLSANPPLFPLLYQTALHDVVLVTLVPQQWPPLPDSAAATERRLHDISFASSLHTELQGLAMARHEASRGLFALGRLERQLRRLRLHHIDADDTTRQLDSLSKLTPHAGLVPHLFAAGQARTRQWLTRHGDDIGRRNTMSLWRRR